jgi:biopolymer transport protein TolQ
MERQKPMDAGRLKVGKLNKISALILLLGLGGGGLFMAAKSFAENEEAAKKTAKTEEAGKDEAVQEVAEETDTSSPSIFSRAWQGGFIVFTVLLILVSMSIVSWAVVISKMINLNKIDKLGQTFVKSFWDSRSLNDLNGRLSEYPYSPVREVFRTGYAELVRASQLREQTTSGPNALAVRATLENLGRSLEKAKISERQRMEKLLPVLAISASSAPFIGLFGTVWGIMGAFEGIARSGSASLAAVAPGISEALIATAFGLAAAIPAVIGYNLAGNHIRKLLAQIDGFSVDFLNIVERYLVADRPKSHVGPSAT